MKKKKWWNVWLIVLMNWGCLRILECGIKGFENWGMVEEGVVDKEIEDVIGDWEKERYLLILFFIVNRY